MKYPKDNYASFQQTGTECFYFSFFNPEFEQTNKLCHVYVTLFQLLTSYLHNHFYFYFNVIYKWGVTDVTPQINALYGFILVILY